MRAALYATLGCLLAFAIRAVAEDSTVVPGYKIEFPRDEGSHPQYRTEWWYVTGWLEQDKGEPLGFQVTFFRTRPGIDARNPSKFAARQVLFAHAALSDPREPSLLHDQRAARAGFELAEAREGHSEVFIDDWSLVQEHTGYHARIPAQTFVLDLNFAAVQPPILQGEGGFSRKSATAGSASYYYSLPHLKVTGSVGRGSRSVPVRGVAWLDHEWSNAYIEPNAVGWDWVGINLDDGGALMAFRMRDAAGNALWSAATHRVRNGAAFRDTSYANENIEWQPLRSWRSARTQTNYPVEWRVRVGDRSLHLKPLLDNQEIDTRQSTGTIYWEGAVTALDEQDQRVGRGYLELTGYNGKLTVGAK